MALCRLKASQIFLNESVTVLHVELCQVLMTWKVIDLIWQMPVTVEMQWVIHASMSCSKEYLWYWYFHPQSISVVRILQKKKRKRKKTINDISSLKHCTSRAECLFYTLDVTRTLTVVFVIFVVVLPVYVLQRELFLCTKIWQPPLPPPKIQGPGWEWCWCFKANWLAACQVPDPQHFNMGKLQCVKTYYHLLNTHESYMTR